MNDSINIELVLEGNAWIAVIGPNLQEGKLRIDTQISELRAMLSSTGEEPSSSTEPIKTRKKFSAATKQRMREAQERRWDNLRGKSEAQPVPVKKSKAKRKLSAAGRAAIVDALKKRWAVKKANAGKAAAKKVR